MGPKIVGPSCSRRESLKFFKWFGVGDDGLMISLEITSTLVRLFW